MVEHRAVLTGLSLLAGNIVYSVKLVLCTSYSGIDSGRGGGFGSRQISVQDTQPAKWHYIMHNDCGTGAWGKMSLHQYAYKIPCLSLSTNQQRRLRPLTLCVTSYKRRYSSAKFVGGL